MKQTTDYYSAAINPDDWTFCPHCEGSAGGPGDRFNPKGACGYCDGAGMVETSKYDALAAFVKQRTGHIPSWESPL